LTATVKARLTQHRAGAAPPASTATVKARLTQQRQTKQRQTRPQQSALLGIGLPLLRRPRPNAPQQTRPQQSVLLEIGLPLQKKPQPQKELWRLRGLRPNALLRSVLLEIGLRLLSVLQLSPEPVARRHWPGLAARCRVW
jgi:hypothetical protein